MGRLTLCDSTCTNDCARKATGNGRFFLAEQELHQIWDEEKQADQVKRVMKLMERVHLSSENKEIKGAWKPTIAGVQVCKTFFIRYLALNRSQVFSALRHIKEGSDPSRIHSKKVRLRRLYVNSSKNDQKLHDIESFLRIFSKRYGDLMPDGVIRLPFKDHYAVYQYIAHQFETKYPRSAPDHISTPSYSYFLRVWAKKCSDIKLCREKGTHSMCTTCANFIATIGKDTLSEADREALCAEQDDHIKLQSLLRFKYRHHINKARFNRTKYLSIIIDGFDGRKSVLPFFKNCPKDIEAGRYNFKVWNTSTYRWALCTSILPSYHFLLRLIRQ
jgi:hypothetical protein